MALHQHIESLKNGGPGLCLVLSVGTFLLTGNLLVAALVGLGSFVVTDHKHDSLKASLSGVLS